MVSSRYSNRIPEKHPAQIIQIPAAELNVRFRIKHPLEGITAHMQLSCNPLSRIGHQLHQAPGTGS